MFRQIIVFTKSPKLPSISGLRKATLRTGRKFIPINPMVETSFVLGENQFCSLTDKKFNSEDLLLIRSSGVEFDDIDLTFAQHLENRGIHAAELLSSLRILRNKDQQMLYLNHLNLPIVPTWILRGKISQEMPWCQKSGVEKFVLKSVRGNKGIGQKLLTRSELKTFWEDALNKNDQRYLIQPYLDSAPEIRVLALGENIFYLGRKEGRDWRKNSDFASFYPYPIGVDEKNTIDRYVSILKASLSLKVFAIDLIRDQEKNWLILEVNGHPGLEASKHAMETSEDPYTLYLRSYDPSF